jgi:diacylglycerol O-acyltransferase
VFLAALAGGYRKYLLDRGEPLEAMVLRAIVPVSRRVPGQPARPGNLASAMFVELPVDLADPVARVHMVAARTAEQKSGEVADATAAVVRMADHIPAVLLAWGARAYGRSGQGRVNVVASNVPGPPQAQYLAGRRVLELIPYVPTAQQVSGPVLPWSPTPAGSPSASPPTPTPCPTPTASSPPSDRSSAIS